MLGHARRDQHRGERCGPRAAGADRGGSEQPAKARLAGTDHPGDGGGLRHRGDHAPRRGVQALRLALAGAVHARRRGRAGARQDPQAGPATLAAGRGRAGGRADAGRAARRDDPFGPAAPWRRSAAYRCARCSGSGRRTVSSRTGYGASSCPPIRRSRPSCATWSACTSIRPHTAWCSRSTRSPRSRRSTGRSRGCRSRRAGPAP